MLSKLFWFIWGLPQNLVGFVMYLMFKKKAIKIEHFRDSVVLEVRHGKLGGAVSLGMFIFIFSDYRSRREWVVKHEYGHSIQSKILGPLYLLVIGLPSITWAGFFKEYRRKNKVSYYWFYPEKWANHLAGIKE